jgi:hypothetical protein
MISADTTSRDNPYEVTRHIPPTGSAGVGIERDDGELWIWWVGVEPIGCGFGQHAR